MDFIDGLSYSTLIFGGFLIAVIVGALSIVIALIFKIKLGVYHLVIAAFAAALYFAGLVLYILVQPFDERWLRGDTLQGTAPQIDATLPGFNGVTSQLNQLSGQLYQPVESYQIFTTYTLPLVSEVALYAAISFAIMLILLVIAVILTLRKLKRRNQQIDKMLADYQSAKNQQITS